MLGFIISLIIGFVLYRAMNRIFTIVYNGFQGMVVAFGACVLIGYSIVEWGIGFAKHHYIWTAIILILVILGIMGARQNATESQAKQ